MNQNTNTADRLRDAVGSVRDVWLDDAETIFESKQIEKRESGFRHFLHSGWAVAAACLVVAVAVYAAIMIAGRGAGGGLLASHGTQHEDEGALEPVFPNGVPCLSVWGKGRTLHLEPWDFALTYPTAGENGDVVMLDDAAGVGCPPHAAADALVYFNETIEDYMYLVDGDTDLLLDFDDDTPPSSVTVRVFRMDGTEVKRGFKAADAKKAYNISVSTDVPPDVKTLHLRQWVIQFKETFDEPLIVEITAEWTEHHVSGHASYAFIRLPTLMKDLTKLPTDHGLSVYVYKMAEGAEPRFVVLPDKKAVSCIDPSLLHFAYTVDEVRAYLSGAGLAPEDISVMPYNMLLSSYYWGPILNAEDSPEERDAAKEKWRRDTECELREMLGIPLPE